MRGEVHDHADVGDAGRERALTTGRHLVDVAQVTIGEPGPQALDGRVVALDVAHATDESLCGKGLRKFPGLGGVLGQRLLDERVHPGVGQLQPDLVVEGRWCRDDAVVDARRDHRVDVGQHLEVPCDAVGVTGGIGNGHQVDAVDGAHVSGVVATHRAQAHQPGAQVPHLRHLPSPAC